MIVGAKFAYAIVVRSDVSLDIGRVSLTVDRYTDPEIHAPGNENLI